MAEKESKDKSKLTDAEIEQCIKVLREHIKALRENEHIKWEDFPEKVGVSQSTINNWGSKNKDGKTIKPKLDSVLMIAAYFNVSLDWLLGLSSNREASPVPITYKEWIITIENYLEYGVVKPLYRPELNDSFQPYDEDTQKNLEYTIETLMSGGLGYQTSYLSSARMAPSEKEESEELKSLHQKKFHLEDDFEPIYTYTPHSDNIYDASKDMDGIYPDVLEIKDTFLRCIIACLHFSKKTGPEEYYKSFRESIIKQYGNKKVLNLDVYELRVPADLKGTEEYKKLLKGYHTISESLFAKYKSIREINTKELSKIWNKLEFWKEEFDNGKIKTVTQLKQEYIEKNNPMAGDDFDL
ncbi:MAG: helix-turn-helix transcriptional regulator [Lachnospiraceae bacterium]|nr:helix-turn-helix transcriptional regulator [Lachnospiraceae bacterium]